MHCKCHISGNPDMVLFGQVGDIICWLSSELLLNLGFVSQLLEVVRRVRAPFVDERDCSAAHLAMQLRKRGYITQLRNAKPRECGKACGRTCLEKLQHTYILVTGSLDSAVTVSLPQPCPDCQARQCLSWLSLTSHPIAVQCREDLAA